MNATSLPPCTETSPLRFVYLRAAYRQLWIVSLMLALLLLALPSQASTSVRAFTPRFQTNAPGDIMIVGNTLMTCSAAVANCITARNGGNFNNNSFVMENVDVDAAAPGNNSSSATLNLTAGSTVLYAGLYWGASSTLPTRNQVSLRVPGAATYQNLTASQLDASGAIYQGFVDVTAAVQAAGNGDYTLANVATTLGSGQYGGWSLVVVFRNSAEQFRNLTVFDGFAVINNTAPTALTVPVSGFLTPATGSVGARIGAVSYEGDLATTGDTMTVNTTNLTDGVNAANNVFNARISRLGSLITAKNPNYANQLGFDIDYFQTTGVLANNATSANITFNTTGDAYYPGVLTTAIDIFVPNLASTLSKSVSDANGGALLPGDILTYTISASNTGQDGAIDIVLTDPIPLGTTYVPGTLQVLTGENAGSKTDAAGDDQANYDSGSNSVVFRLGLGANATQGGTLLPTQSTSVSFQVRVNPGTFSQTIVNTATATFRSQTLGTPFAEPVSVSITVVGDVQLSHSKTLVAESDPVNGTTNPKLIPGANAIYTLEVVNSGSGGVDDGTMVIVDPVPANSTLFTGNFSGGAPFAFVDGSLTSGLSCPFVALSSLTDCIDFSNNGGATWIYVPNGAVDPAVTHVRFRLTGGMLGDATAGAPSPSFQLRFRVNIN